MFTADILVRNHGRAVVVVEVKGRPVPPNLLVVVHQQLSRYVHDTGSAWSVLADPDLVRIYKQDIFGKPVAELATSQLLEAAGLERVPHVGEGVLVLALRRWLKDLSNGAVKTDGELAAFVDAIRGSEEILTEAQVA